jgi:HD-GYP domain-containing protein (c-di-GMP phosphodiesterase class II)
MAAMPSPLNTQDLLVQLNRIGLALSSERNLDALLELILTEMRQFSRAEGGTLYLRDGDHLHFTIAQNDRLDRRDGPAGATIGALKKFTVPLDEKSLAGYAGVTGKILNLDDVYEIPADRPFHFNRDFDARNSYRTRSMMIVPMKDILGNVIGVVQLINALDDAGNAVPFDRALEPLALSLASQAAVSVRNAQLTEDLKDAQYDTIFRLSVAAEYRDADTAQHIHRMSRYAGAIARARGMPAGDIEILVHASPMHDVGKLGIPDAVLQKPGKLTPEEFREMQKHTIIGGKILARARSPILQASEQIALTHHEKWDGTGYPNGLKGDAIPLPGRISAIADVFDALTSKRCYKPPFGNNEALEIIKQGAGKQFDASLVDTFTRVMDEVLAIKKEFADPEPEAPAGG